MAKRVMEFTIAALIFTVLTIIFFSDVISSNTIFAFRDLGRYFYPLRSYAFGLLRQGIIPFWNPFIYCGNPLIATHQVALFYPVSLIYLVGDFNRAFNNFIYLHFILAGLFMYIFLRDQRLPKIASFIGAVTFAFSGYMFATMNLLVSFASGIWLPLILWAFFRARERRDYRYAVLAAVFLAVMFLAGEPSVSYMACLILLIGGLKDLKMVFTIFATALALSAVAFLPLAELLLNSDRFGMTYDFATKWSVAPYNFLNLLFPCVTDVEHVLKDYWDKQSWLLHYYLGIFPLIMLPVAAFFAKGTKRFFAFSILAASVLISLGHFTPAYHLFFKYLPGFKFFRYPVKYFYLTTFSLAWLAAIGYGFYEDNARSDNRLAEAVKLILYLALILSPVLLAVDLFFGRWVDLVHKWFFLDLDKTLKGGLETTPFISTGFFSIRRTLAFFLLFALCLFVGTKRSIRTKAVSAGIAFFVLTDLYFATFYINFSCDIMNFKKPSGNIAFLMQDKSLFRVLSSPANARLLMNPTQETYKDVLEIGKERLYANRMMEYGIYDAGGYESLDRQRMIDVLRYLMYCVKNPDETRVLDMLNVKYVASPKIFEAKGYRMAHKSDIANIYENTNVLPRAYLSEQTLVIKDKRKIFDKFNDRNWDPAKEVMLEEEPVLKYQSVGVSEYQGAERAEITKYSPNEVIIDVAVRSPKFLVLSDSYYPGWKVFVDERADKIYLANYILRAVYLPAGIHTVKFVMDPFSFKLGLTITVLTLFSIIAFYIVYSKK